jgi:plasmid stabilization system protein ParE
MGSKEVEFHEEARGEAVAALEWYLERSEVAAGRFLEELDRAIQLVASSPSRWPEYVSRTRRFLLHRFPFAVIYRELPSRIQVLAVAHTRRRPGYWKERV